MANRSFWRALFPSKLRAWRQINLLAWFGIPLISLVVELAKRDLSLVDVAILAVLFPIVSAGILYDAWRAYHEPDAEEWR
jgi:hypothetical protein